MIYKDYEIFARVHKSMSDLYTLTDDGELDESMDILIDNGYDDIVWYEVEGFHDFYNSLEEAKQVIDDWIKESQDEY